MHIWDRLPEENLRQFAAWVAFRDAPLPRSMRAVSKALGVPLPTCYYWSKLLCWHERAAAWDAYVDQAVQSGHLEAARERGAQIALLREQALSLALREVTSRLADVDSEGHPLTPMSAQALVALLRTIEHLSPDAAIETPREEVDLTQLSDEELHRYEELIKKVRKP